MLDNSETKQIIMSSLGPLLIKGGDTIIEHLYSCDESVQYRDTVLEILGSHQRPTLPFSSSKAKLKENKSDKLANAKTVHLLHISLRFYPVGFSKGHMNLSVEGKRQITTVMK